MLFLNLMKAGSEISWDQIFLLLSFHGYLHMQN